ncbi:hypothetical protein CC86DRAFT_46052 [Ophiobolus disseminans]|uniref:Uncharacterized protein n=1 Tax=Ophiobolus disseminans TaxID=1469910 RepID=A0A6A6ZVD5_9PLEO|nr:hypothetical protein CC86DRAFT_46052 [Ophiobolus disseminans]
MTDSTPWLHGWFSLPDELKLEVIRYTVPSGERLHGFHFDKDEEDKIDRYDNLSRFEYHLPHGQPAPHLR